MSPDHGHNHDTGHDHGGGHGHSHGLVARSIVSSREGLKAVSLSLLVLLVTAALQGVVFILSGSIALLADLIHNGGDAMTAIPLGIAFWLRSFKAEKRAGYFVVATIFASACVALWQSIDRLINPQPLHDLAIVAAAGVIGFIGNEIAAQIRTRAGNRLDSPALLADGAHARVDGFVSLSVVASAIVVALGLNVGDPIIGLIISLVILRITWQSFATVKQDPGLEEQHEPIPDEGDHHDHDHKAQADQPERILTAAGHDHDHDSHDHEHSHDHDHDHGHGHEH